MKKIVLTVAALAMLGACSTSTNVDPWIGRSEDEVIARLGLPVRAYKSHEKKYMVYDFSQTKTSSHWFAVSNGIYTVSRCGYVSPVSPCGKTTVTLNGSAGCQTIFILEDGEVEDWTTAGRCGY